MATSIIKKYLLSVLMLLSLVLEARAQGWENIEWSANNKLYAKQAFMFEGTVLGTDHYEPVPYPLQGAHIRMTCLGDTTIAGGMAAGKDGEFWVYLSSRSRLKDTRLHIEISYLGMQGMDTIVQVQSRQESGIDVFEVDMDTIVLQSEPITPGEVEIVAELTRMYQRGDTTIFNVDAYEMPSGSVLLDLVRRLPGLKYQNGSLTYMDRSIEEIRLNGDEYFKRDMTIALNNMPTQKLKSLKVYEVLNDTLDRHSDEHLVMDMETSQPMDHTLYANAQLGTNEKFTHSQLVLDASDWRKDVGEAYGNFSHSDIPESYSHLLENKNTYGNLSLSRNFEDRKISYAYLNGYCNSSSTRTKDSSLSKTFMPDYTQSQGSENENANGNNNWNGYFGMNGKIRKSNWSVSANMSDSHSSNWSQGRDSISNDDIGMVRSTTHESSNRSHSLGMGTSFNFNNRFGKDDKYSLGVDGNFNHSNAESVTDDMNRNRFYQYGDSASTIRHRIVSPSQSDRIGSSLWIDRMVSSGTSLGLRYNFNLDNVENSSSYSDIMDNDQLERVDSLDSRSQNRIIGNSISMTFWHSDSLLRADANAQLRSNITKLDEVQGHTSDLVKQNTIDYSLNANLQYKALKWLRTGIRYNGSSHTPSASQLSTTIDYSDPMNISSGNSNLKKSFSHTFSLELQVKSWMRLTGNYTLNRNTVSTLVVLDRQTGARRTRPENINGNWSTTQGLFLAAPFKDVSLTFNANHNFRRTVSFTQSFSDSKPSLSIGGYHSASCSLNAGYSNKNWLLSSNAGYSVEKSRNDYKSAVSGGQRITAGVQAEFNCDMGLSASTDCNLNKPFGYELESANRMECIWSIRAGYVFLKDRKASLHLEWHDILNSYNGFSTAVTATGWNESRNYGETSMLLLRFSYRFNSF